jgi:hypothetical protein
LLSRSSKNFDRNPFFLKNNLAPIVLFVYNRPYHAVQTLLALAENELANQSRLFIYADGPPENPSGELLQNIKLTREAIRKQEWCGSVHIKESGYNMGLSGSVISGVSEVIAKYGKVIVLEDDLITGRYFLSYMNEALDRFEQNPAVMQVSGHFFPVRNVRPAHRSFLMPMTTSWGWATWNRAWSLFDKEAKGFGELESDRSLSYRFDLDGSYPYSSMLLQQMRSSNIDSWAIRWWWTVFRHSGLAVFPDRTLVKNIGFDEKSTHTKKDPFGSSDFDPEYRISVFPEKLEMHRKNFSEVKKFLTLSQANRGGGKANFLNSLTFSLGQKLSRIFNRNK